MIRLSFYPVGGDDYLLVAVVALALLVLLMLGPARGKTTPQRRAALVGLRLAVIFLVILTMLRPTLVYTETRKQPATLVVLADKSRSMSVRDEVNGQTRYEALRMALSQARDALRALGKDFEIKAYGFDADPYPVEVADGEIALDDAPDGQQTAIGFVLESVLRAETDKRLLGVLLLGDGAQRAYPPRDVLPQAPAGRMKHLGYPLYALRFGQSRGLGQVQDVAVTELLADPLVFVKNELVVSGQVRIDGYVNREIPVQLAVEKSPGKTEVVAQKNVKALADGEMISVQFTYVPESPGEVKLTLEAAPQTGELVTTNNRLSTFTNVLKGGIRVLYVEGFPPRSEQVFVGRRSLAASADINVDIRNINLRAPETRPKDLSGLLKPGKCDVYILGDVDSSAFTKEELADLADAVDKGAGLMMLGGVHSFGPGGYAGTPLVDVLPVRMDRLERQPPDAPIGKDLYLPGPLKMRPTEIGEKQYSLMLAGSREENAALWSRLPPLDGANKLLGVKRGALILAVDDRERPLLVSQDLGAGRVMAFAADSTWRWWMHGFEPAHKRFWRQVVLWLAKKDEMAEGNVWIKLPQRRFAPGQRAEFTAGAHAPTGEPVQGASYTAEVTLPDGSKRPLPLTPGVEQAAGSFRDTQQPGDYTVQVTARQDGKELGTGRARFLVLEQDLELDNALADATLLDSLAAATGGQSVVPEELPGLIRRLAENTQDLEVQRETKATFWDTWPFFLTLVGLLGAEWYLRKRWGLV